MSVAFANEPLQRRRAPSRDHCVMHAPEPGAILPPMHARSLALGFASLLLAVSSAGATPIAVHSGAEDPTTEGWILNDGGPGGVVVAPGNEGGHDFWQVWDPTSDGGGAYYLIPDAAAFSGDWRFEVRLRVVDSPMVPSAPGAPGTGVIVRDGANYWSFYLANDRVGPIAPSVSLARTFYLDTRNDYHSYAIQFSANGPGLGDDRADFYVDGALVFAGVTRSELYATTDRAIGFGGVSTEGTSRANYDWLSFENAQADPRATATPTVTASPTPNPQCSRGTRDAHHGDDCKSDDRDFVSPGELTDAPATVATIDVAAARGCGVADFSPAAGSVIPGLLLISLAAARRRN